MAESELQVVCVLAQVGEGEQECPLRDPRQLDQVMGATRQSWAVMVGPGLVTGKPGPSASLARTWASGAPVVGQGT